LSAVHSAYIRRWTEEDTVPDTFLESEWWTTPFIAEAAAAQSRGSELNRNLQTRKDMSQ